MIKGPLLIARYEGDPRIEKQVKEARQRLIIDTFRNAKPIVVQSASEPARKSTGVKGQ